MNISTNFKFNLPTLQDSADVTKISDNFQKIDTEIYSKTEIDNFFNQINKILNSFIDVSEVGQ
jgi:3-methyladenine DNA glycosylase AlkC